MMLLHVHMNSSRVHSVTVRIDALPPDAVHEWGDLLADIATYIGMAANDAYGLDEEMVRQAVGARFAEALAMPSHPTVTPRRANGRKPT